MEDLGIHAQRLMHRVRHSHIVEKLAHEPARGEHNVEALVQPAQVATQNALGESPSETPTEDLGEVRMVERCDGNASLLRYAAGAPCGMKRVTGFDETRVE